LSDDLFLAKYHDFRSYFGDESEAVESGLSRVKDDGLANPASLNAVNFERCKESTGFYVRRIDEFYIHELPTDYHVGVALRISHAVVGALNTPKRVHCREAEIRSTR